MTMKITDRYLFCELLKFALLALLTVVTIYLLIDLFEELGYFTSRKVPFLLVLRYYFYSLPSAIVLLYPVSLILAVFVVYGQMTRYNEILAFKSAGVLLYRLFLPAVIMGLATMFLYLVGNEFVAIPFNRNLGQLRRYKIEKRSDPAGQSRQDLYRVDGKNILWIREIDYFNESKPAIHKFVFIKLNHARKVAYRVDGEEAVYENTHWRGRNITTRKFFDNGGEAFVRQEETELESLNFAPHEWVTALQAIEEMPTLLLGKYIRKLKGAGENVAREEVEYHYRIAYAMVGLIVVLLALPMAVKLRRGGVMFGLGLGLLFSFLYWGAFQICRAFGTSHVISPALSVWIPNIGFGIIAAILMAIAEK